MRIAVFSWETLHSIPVGGAAVHTTELSAALCRRGHEVHLFTRMGRGQATYDHIDGVHYHRCPFETGGDLTEEAERMCDSFLWHFGETEAFLHNGGFDIVHGHDWLSSRALVRTKNSNKKPTVITLHSTEFGRCGNEHRPGRSELISHLEWEGTYVADQVICVSEALRQEAKTIYQLPSEKVVAVYNGVHAWKFDGFVDPNAVRAHYGIEPLDPVVLFVGRMAWQKGPDILLATIPAILHQYPNAKFIFVGTGDMLADLQADAEELSINHAVRFVGYRSGAELINLFKSVDLLCVPSRNEPFGIVILEAWSASKPVVASRNGGPAEFVNHGHNGLVVEDDCDSVGWGVSAAFADLDHARWMGRNGRNEAESRFTWDAVAAHTEQVYQAARQQ